MFSDYKIQTNSEVGIVSATPADNIGLFLAVAIVSSLTVTGLIMAAWSGLIVLGGHGGGGPIGILAGLVLA